MWQTCAVSPSLLNGRVGAGLEPSSVEMEEERLRGFVQDSSSSVHDHRTSHYYWDLQLHHQFGKRGFSKDFCIKKHFRITLFEDADA